MRFLRKTLVFVFLVFSLFSTTITAAQAGWVSGYYKSNGTYVDGYYRSDANGLKYDNYSWEWGDDLYNDSYYDYGRSSEWYTPSWEWQNDYWTGLDSYSSYNDYDGYWDSGYDYYDDYDYGWSSYDYDW